MFISCENGTSTAAFQRKHLIYFCLECVYVVTKATVYCVSDTHVADPRTPRSQQIQRRASSVHESQIRSSSVPETQGVQHRPFAHRTSYQRQTTVLFHQRHHDRRPVLMFGTRFPMSAQRVDRGMYFHTVTYLTQIFRYRSLCLQPVITFEGVARNK